MAASSPLARSLPEVGPRRTGATTLPAAVRATRASRPSIQGYELGELLGEGGMGQVFAARDLRAGADVAIKVLRAELIGNPDASARFEREAMHTSALAGLHAVRVLDVGVAESGQPYMTMERLDGSDLGNLLDERGPFPIDQALFWVAQACDAMTEPHERGIVHRDLKPSNLFCAMTNDGLVLKVLDFGISRATEDSRLTRTLTAVGTPIYMSPEQARSEHAIDHRADVWSLGVILYELLTGQVPFEGKSPTSTALAVCSATPLPPSHHRSEISPTLDAVVMRALEKDPARRYSDVREMRAALDAVASGVDALTPAALEPAVFEPTLPAPETLQPTLPVPIRAPRAKRVPRSRAVAAAAALGMFGLLLVLAAPGAQASTLRVLAEAPLAHFAERSIATPAAPPALETAVEEAPARAASPAPRSAQAGGAPSSSPAHRASPSEPHRAAPAARSRPKFDERH